MSGSDSTVEAAGWTRPLSLPAMANQHDRHHRIGLTSRYLTRDGQPWIPVSGELHYSRVPRERWRERLLLMKAGGVDIVSTYLLWIHHEPEAGRASFDGNLDVAGFVRLCEELGLHVVVRIGPWCHGETRNGGFPDWVQRAQVAHRTDDPGYLALAAGWYRLVGEQLAGLCGPDSPIIGIQVENELYDQPGHLRTLATMARAAGLHAPLWTATAWGGAELPGEDFLPLYSGYGDGFWVAAGEPWHATFRAHYFMSDVWDDPGTGADVRGVSPDEVLTRPRDERFPPATCELGGGMAITYHRRIVPVAADVAAVGNAKIGSGSAWQGYYMFAGGTNPRPGLQESHETGYPNDLPELDYDFHAPVGAAGELADSHAALRRQHALLAAFGDRIATMPATLPATVPGGLDDTTTLRWAVRADGRSGFAFVNWYQPHLGLPVRRGTRLAVEAAGATVVFGSGPVDLPPGTVAAWPFGLDIGVSRLRWATASVLTRLADDTLVLVAEPGIPVELGVGDGIRRVDGRRGGLVELGDEPGTGRVLVVGTADRDRVWVLEHPGGRELVLSEDPAWIDDGELVIRAARRPDAARWAGGGWSELELLPVGAAEPARRLPSTLARPGRPVPAGYGQWDGRASAPGREEVAELGAVFRLADAGVAGAGHRRVLRIAWAGDVAQLLVDGRVVADRFWDGSEWVVDLDAIPGAEADRLAVRIVGLSPLAPIWLPAAALDRRRCVAGDLLALDAVSLECQTWWRTGVGG
ncbi:MAG: beta-galactosidase [Propionicimonas sp.]|nr:beta-galactosidase [Propionicimonas sp.]